VPALEAAKWQGRQLERRLNELMANKDEGAEVCAMEWVDAGLRLALLAASWSSLTLSDHCACPSLSAC
jgi:hypothetical protein